MIPPSRRGRQPWRHGTSICSRIAASSRSRLVTIFSTGGNKLNEMLGGSAG